MAETQIPVTVLTGYLGAGKTTLLNRILSENHGKKYAVVVNEFGEIGIDNDLIVESDEEIYEMNNGCICCTVRGDLIRVVEGLMKRPGGFDGILVETTGLANPAPVAQTFFMDDDVRAKSRLDAVITVADAMNLLKRLDDSPEAEEQIAFALKQAEVGCTVAEVCRKMGISEATFYNWKKKYGGLGVSELRRLKQLENENARLKRMVADLSLDKQMLQDVVQKSCEASAQARAGELQRELANFLIQPYRVSIRRATAVLQLRQATYFYKPTPRDDRAE